jgi:hypothetical protein
MSTPRDLNHTQGYEVDTCDGRIGSVVAVLPERRGRPGFLLVHSGLMSCALTTVPFSDVETVDPERRRVALRALPRTMQGRARAGVSDRIIARA